jgi:hypothetical protein
MASLFDRRTLVSDEQRLLARKVWRAYGSATPETLAGLLQQDTSALPFLRAALQKHLERFPSTRNGLGIIEHRALQLMGGGRKNFSELFVAFGKAEPVFGLGDAQFWNLLKQLAEAPVPALSIAPEALGQAGLPEGLLELPIELTGFGEAVLAGKDDFIRTNGINQWLGGVHLTAEQVWRWQAESQTLLLEPSSTGQR